MKSLFDLGVDAMSWRGVGAMLLSLLLILPAVRADEAIPDEAPPVEVSPRETQEENTGERPAVRKQAVSVPLDQPVIVTPPESPIEATENIDGVSPGTEKTGDVPAAVPVPEEEIVAPFVILDTAVPPGTSTRLSWAPPQSLEGIATPTPVLVVNGVDEGPVLCLIAALHGDELNGIEIVRRVLYNLDPKGLAGTVIGVPIMNLQGFFRGSRYLADRRDLNRYFPGNPWGSSASRIAYSFFNEVIRHCDALVDLHTGSFYRTNMPQLRADLRYPQVVELTQGFGGTVVLQSDGASGSLRRAAVEAGIPTVTLEAGESMRLQEEAVEHGVNGITTLMSKMGMLERFSFWGDPEPVYYNSVWIRAEQGGILFSNVELADLVEKGDLLGEVTDPITNIKTAIVSPYRGRVIGMALNQVVLPGFAAFHIAIQAPRAAIKKPRPVTVKQKDTPAAVPPAPENGAATQPQQPASGATVPQEPDVMDADGDMAEFPGDDIGD